MRKLEFKSCRICGKPVTPIPRKDRKAFWYPRQCNACKGKCRNNKLRIERLKQTMSGKGNPRYQPIGTKVMVYRRGIPYYRIKVADPDIWVYEHRLVMEQILERPLKTYELIHHKDGNGLNNKIENLQLVNKTTHMANHHITTWARKHDYCRRCRTTEYPHLCHGLCKQCYSYLKWHKELEQWVL